MGILNKLDGKKKKRGMLTEAELKQHAYDRVLAYWLGCEIACQPRPDLRTQKIQAILAVRQATGASLSEATEWVKNNLTLPVNP